MTGTTIGLLETLSNTFGVAGFEDDVQTTIQELVGPYVDEVRIDTLGNLIARRNGSSSKTLMIDAHMDEIGFMVSYIEESGFLRFAPIGGWDARIVPSHAMTIRTDSGRDVKGIIGTLPPHLLSQEDRNKPFKLEDLFIDIGAGSAQEVADLGIRIGSPAVISYSFEQLNEQFVTGKALDDRAGCAVLIETLKKLQNVELDVNVVANFAVREEVGLIGAGTAAYQIDPDLALVLEGTICADIPGVPASRQPTRAGEGPAISVADRSQIVKSSLVQWITKIAEDAQAPYQYKLPPFGGTDAGVIQRSRGGVVAGVISVPCRYIHSPFSVMRLDDFDHTVQLTTAFAHRSRELLEG